ncbi:MAG: hypothetical protein SGJ09_06000 [Phycisphaerae bacterium]|nr:hypothetical protein [Phycisphaerae bacterium]
MRVPIAMLFHELADGSSHVDVLIAFKEDPFSDDDHAVASWRSDSRPDRLPPQSMVQLERITDHRAEYLRLAAPRELSDDRGRVTPLAQGVAQLEVVGDEWALEIAWDDGARSSWAIVKREGSAWRLTSR